MLIIHKFEYNTPLLQTIDSARFQWALNREVAAETPNTKMRSLITAPRLAIILKPHCLQSDLSIVRQILAGLFNKRRKMIPGVVGACVPYAEVVAAV